MPVPGVLLSRQLRKAISLFRRALEINPNNWSAMWFIGKVHQRFREDKDALEWFKQSYDVNPSQTDIAREASLCAMQIGNHDMAIVFAHRAIQVDPTNPGLGANLALAYLLAGRIRDAQASISQALAGDPSDTISQTISTMVQHFGTTGRVPPTTTADLLSYWQQERQAAKR
jgi:Flp pilus assembly protein TadD